MKLFKIFCHLIFFFSFEEKHIFKSYPIEKSYPIDLSLCCHQIQLHIFSGYIVQFLKVEFRQIMIFIMLKYTLCLSRFYTLNSIYSSISMVHQLNLVSIFPGISFYIFNNFKFSPVFYFAYKCISCAKELDFQIEYYLSYQINTFDQYS